MSNQRAEALADHVGQLQKINAELREALAGLLKGHPSGDNAEQKIARAALAKARGETK